MMIHDITEKAGPYKARKRVGRGPGSGHGKTSGRGHKGAKSRAGYSARFAFEGGQMPMFRRLAKRGFANTRFRTEFWTCNLGDIVQHPDFVKGGDVSAASLVAAGLIRDEKRPLKILGDLKGVDSLAVKLTVHAARVTASARKLIEDAGGTVDETGSRRDRVRGIDRNSGDPTPKNLTKKPKNRAAKVFDDPPKGKGKDKGKDKSKKADKDAKVTSKKKGDGKSKDAKPTDG